MDRYFPLLHPEVFIKTSHPIRKSYPDLNWNVINLIPLESLTLDHMVILHNILLISIVVFILSVFFSILCTGTVTAPIQKLVEKMKSASAGKLNISASYSSNDELAVLYNQFNLMMQKIQTLLNDIYEAFASVPDQSPFSL